MAAKKIHTVLGPIEPSQLGITFTHEHLSIQVDHVLYEPPPPHQAHMADCVIDQHNRPWIAQNFMQHRRSMVMNDAEAECAILEDVKRFGARGGGTLLDCGSIGLMRKDAFLKTVASEAGINVVAGGGFYRHVTQTDWAVSSIEQLAEQIRNQLSTALDDPKAVQCGFIGEVGVSWPIHEFEKRSMSASGVVNSETGCPVLIHPAHTKEGLFEVVRTYEEAGGDASKLVIAHLDWPTTAEDTLEFAAESPKVWLELDNFGNEMTLTGFPAAPSDVDRVRLLVALVDLGFEDRIVLSHDIAFKTRLEKFGGHGISHLLNLSSTVMKQFGLTEQQIAKFFIENPKNWLAY